MLHNKHLNSYKSLITPYEETRAGFIALSLEKSREATPFIEEAKTLKVIAEKATNPKKLLDITEIQSSLLTASGISDKAKNYLQDRDKKKAIIDLIENFLEPSGKYFIDELVYRFLLSKGDTLGGSIRNLAGVIGERKFTRILISVFSVSNKNFMYLDANSRTWHKPKMTDQCYELDLEKRIKGLCWRSLQKNRVLIYNLKVPIVKKNIDLSLLNCSYKDILFSKKTRQSAHYEPQKYIALGELKGGIDPAGADERWKTANSALERIRKSFKKHNCIPHTFFIGSAIETSMAKEIYQQLHNLSLTNCANLTQKKQMVSLCSWLINL